MKIKLIFAFLIMLLFVTGCTASPRTLETQMPNGAVIINEGNEKTYRNQTTALNYAQQLDYEHCCADVRAETITNAITAIDGIECATVVVSGNRAIVGLILDRKVSDEELFKLKRSVDKKIKQIDVDIERTAITTAPDLLLLTPFI